MKKITLLVLLFAILVLNGQTAEAFPAGENPVIGQTYYITGRNVWIRDEPNTNIEAIASYRFGEPVTLLGVEGNGKWGHVRLCNGWDRYVHMDYVGPMSAVKAKQKDTSLLLITLDRVYDDVERLMESMYPNGPNEKAPSPAQRTASCKALMQRLNDAGINLENSAASAKAKNDIRDFIGKMKVLINALAEWDNGGEEQYTPYFLDTFMPAYDQVGDQYR
ncbi:MAG: hypothetical protein IJG43_09000 [Acidaminococcaceae bacterium]|nr:hypothetical protein [Acidaminococcaceae bacterium]